MQNGVRNAGRAARGAAGPARARRHGAVQRRAARAGQLSPRLGWHARRRESRCGGAADRGVPCAPTLALELRDDMLAVQWAKLVMNLNNAINALSGIPLAAELAQRGYRRSSPTAQREALDLLRAAQASGRARDARRRRAGCRACSRCPIRVFRRLAGARGRDRSLRAVIDVGRSRSEAADGDRLHQRRGRRARRAPRHARARQRRARRARARGGARRQARLTPRKRCVSALHSITANAPAMRADEQRVEEPAVALQALRAAARCRGVPAPAARRAAAGGRARRSDPSRAPRGTTASRARASSATPSV